MQEKKVLNIIFTVMGIIMYPTMFIPHRMEHVVEKVCAWSYFIV